MTNKEAKSRMGGMVESGFGNKNLANSCVRKSGTWEGEEDNGAEEAAGRSAGEDKEES